MTPRKKSNLQKLAEISFNPINDPQTIPSGWDVAAFYEPEHEFQQAQRMTSENTASSNQASQTYDSTQNPVS